MHALSLVPQPTALDMYEQAIREAQSSLERIAAFMVREQWASSHEEAYQAVQAFMQWMCAASFSDKTQAFVMFFGPVDHAFHAAVLHTELYAKLCDRYAGFFINHNPLAEDER
ncbi:hypothetical protein EBT25_14750, partial [bacterium]|nr:hypothetical protein [bacterium]